MRGSLAIRPQHIRLCPLHVLNAQKFIQGLCLLTFCAVQDVSLPLARLDLEKKSAPLNPISHGPVEYTLAYTATCTHMQFHVVDKDGKVRNQGPACARS